MPLWFTACSVFPSSWNPFGTPVQREQKAAAKVAGTQTDLDLAAQRAVHQAGSAIASARQDAPESKALAVAEDFNAEAQALLDQAHGAPGAADLAAWKQLVADVVAGNEKVRALQAAEVARLSAKLTKEEAAHAHTIAQLSSYAQENAGLADWVRKLALGAICIVVFIVATHLIGLAASLNPGSALLGGAASTMGSMLASGTVLAARSAKDGLARVGAGLALVRQKLPAVAAEVTSYLDAATATHPSAQAHIAAGASAAGSTPPP